MFAYQSEVYTSITREQLAKWGSHSWYPDYHVAASAIVHVQIAPVEITHPGRVCLPYASKVCRKCRPSWNVKAGLQLSRFLAVPEKSQCQSFPRVFRFLLPRTGPQFSDRSLFYFNYVSYARHNNFDGMRKHACSELP